MSQNLTKINKNMINFVRFYSESQKSGNPQLISNLLKRIDDVSSKSKTHNKKINTFIQTVKNRPQIDLTTICYHPLKSVYFNKKSGKLKKKTFFLKQKTEKQSKKQNSYYQHDNLKHNVNTKRNAWEKNYSQPRLDETLDKSLFSNTQHSNKTQITAGMKSKHCFVTPNFESNLFFQGKITSINTCLKSRVVSLAKDVLEKSNYPYLMKPSIIKSIKNDSKPRNRFLLQNNFSTSVDRDELYSKFKEIVQGKFEELHLDKKAFDNSRKLDFFTDVKNNLMGNGYLSIEDKKKIFDIVSGVIKFKDLFQDAYWTKNK